MSLPTLQQLQRQALLYLTHHHTVPQRYGTAFHITPPTTDVRTLPGEDFAPGELSDFRTLASFTLDESDVYLQWHLAHLDRLGVTSLTVPAGQSRQLTLTNNDPMSSQLVCCTLEEGAHLTVFDHQRGGELVLRRVMVIQQAQSTLEWWGVRADNRFLNEKLTVYLRGEAASAQVRHLLIENHAHQSDISVVVHHEEPHATSDVVTRLAAGGSAVAMYRGLIDVARRAAGTNGYQQGKALLLSARAVIDVLPELAINTNDVRCSHGVSTTHIDEQALFYLRSRGLPVADATRLAIHGFFHNGLVLPSAISKSITRALAAQETEK